MCNDHNDYENNKKENWTRPYLAPSSSSSSSEIWMNTLFNSSFHTLIQNNARFWIPSRDCSFFTCSVCLCVWVCEELNPTAHIYSLYNSTSSSAPVSGCSARTATPRLCTPAPRRSRFHHLSCVSADVPRWFWVSAVRCCCLTPCCFRVCCQRSARGWWWRDEVEITENTHSRVPSCTALRLPPSRSSLTLSLKGTCCTNLCLKINRVCVYTQPHYNGENPPTAFF